MQAIAYRAGPNGALTCTLCPHHCIVRTGQYGRCLTRKHEAGIMLADNYGKVTSMALDPIEKKPLYHFMPGSKVLSIGSYGCNLRCDFCQNAAIAQNRATHRCYSPQEICDQALATVPQGNIGIAYTYNEPLVWIEFVCDVAARIRGAGLQNILISNGFATPSVFAQLLPRLDAINIDLKGWHPDFYTKTCGGSRDTVLANIAQAAQADHIHLELTTLIIPGYNDDPADNEALFRYIADLSPEIPLHLSRFFPQHRLTHVPKTPLATLEALAEQARTYLHHVYLGNV